MTVWLEGVLKSRVSLCSAELTVSLPHLAVQMLRNNITPENLQALKTEMATKENQWQEARKPWYKKIFRKSS